MILDMIASNRIPVQIKISEPKSIEHFFSPQSYINTILNEQINRDRIYDFFFDGKEDLVVVDAGANVGLFSIFCSPSSQVVYAIEPTPSHFSILNHVISSSEINNIKPINYALWNEDEEIRFYIVDHNTTSNSAVSPTNNFVTVNGRKLQTIINENNIKHIDLLKMDIEGSEFKVITDEFLDYIYPIVDNLFVEVHTYPQYCSDFPSCQQRIVEMFKGNKYKVDIRGMDGMFIYK